FKVHSCPDGESALAAFQKLHPDLVVVETMIPKRNGFEVCRDLKKTPEGSRVPVVITSGVFKGWRYRSEALQTYGCQEFLGRGFSPADLVKTVRSLMPSAFVDSADQPGPEAATAPARSMDEEAAATVRLDHAPFDEDFVHLGEGEITSILDSLFPSSDSGDLARQLATRESFPQTMSLEQRLEQELARERHQAAARPHEISLIDPLPATSSGASPEFLDSPPFQEEASSPADRPPASESSFADLIDTPSFEIDMTHGDPSADHEALETGMPASADPSTHTAGEWFEEPARADHPIPNLDPREISNIGPIAKVEHSTTISLADEPVRSAPARLAAIDAIVTPRVEHRPKASLRAGYALAALAVAGAIVVVWWMAGSSMRPDRTRITTVPSRPAPRVLDTPSPDSFTSETESKADTAVVPAPITLASGAQRAPGRVAAVSPVRPLTRIQRATTTPE
ncbi:MAG: response regulator transcription factor, partial [Vicinamibacteria bacterium]